LLDLLGKFNKKRHFGGHKVQKMNIYA